MSKYSIEESTLTSIANAIRNKSGETGNILVSEMADDIMGIGDSPDDLSQEDLTLRSTVYFVSSAASQQLKDKINNFIETYKYKFRFKDVNYIQIPYLEDGNYNIFKINLEDGLHKGRFMQSLTNVKTFPKFVGNNISFYYMFYGMQYIRYIPNSFFDNFTYTDRIYGYNSSMFQGCYSLRKIPERVFEIMLENMNGYDSQNFFNSCYSLDEILNITQLNLSHPNIFYGCCRVKDITFKQNSEKLNFYTVDANLDLAHVGYTLYDSDIPDRILNYNSGITADKEVTDDASYQLLKNDPDWWTRNQLYSRYNHDSAVRTINSLPSDKNKKTITFAGSSGRNTDGGAIETLTSSEIAVAAAKGWTVAFN